MDLMSFLAQYENVRLADEEDNDSILKVFNAAPMSSSSVLIRYDRGKDFFKLMKWRSEQFYIIVALEDSGEINGVVTISIKDHWIDGALQKIAYFSDLRFNNMNNTLRFWRSIAKDLLRDFKTIEEFRNLKGFFLSTLASNGRLKRAIEDIGYFKRVLTYEMVNIFGKFPLPKGPCSFQIKTIYDYETLRKFHENYQKMSCLGVQISKESFSHERFKRWIGVYSERGELLASAALVDSREAKANIIMRLPLKLKLLMILLRPIGRIFSFSAFNEGDSFNVLYISHLCFDLDREHALNQACFRAIVNEAFKLKESDRYNALSFVDTVESKRSSFLKGYLYQKEKLEIYCTKETLVNDRKRFDYDMSLV